MEQSEISPFLVELGLSKGVMSLVWIAGPLSGILVQPYVGMKSDRCRSRFGKRRPFMVGGAVATIASLMILIWSFEITSGILSVFHVSKDNKGTKITAIVVSILMLYILDFSINVLQASARTFVVDSAPTHQQDFANAWASRLSGIGEITGFLLGYLNLSEYLRFLGDSQFKQLGFITSLALMISVTFTVCTVPERDGRLSEGPEKQDQNLKAFFTDLWYCMMRLPPQIKNVCYVQLAAWIGWFPVLFYTTVWIREIYMAPILKANPDVPADALSEEGTRKGSFGLLLRAVVTITCSIAFPWIVSKVPWLTLKRVWVASHLIFTLLVMLTFVVNNVMSAITLSACMGVPWAITLWVPFALIAKGTKDEDGDEAGAILGIHNMAIALPQVIAILVSSAIFTALEDPSTHQVGPDSVAWVLRVGGVSSLVAAGLTLRVKEDRP